MVKKIQAISTKDTFKAVKFYFAQYLAICHWNLNSIAVHNFIKIALLKAYLSVHNMDILCLSGAFLDFSTLIDDENLQFPVYSSVRVDHPSIKYGGLLLNYKSLLPKKSIDFYYSKEYISFELRIGRKVFVSL